MPNVPVIEKIGQAIRERRLLCELTQGDIEKRTGIKRCYQSRVENGYQFPTLRNLEIIANALNLRLSRLIALAEREENARG